MVVTARYQYVAYLVIKQGPICFPIKKQNFNPLPYTVLKKLTLYVGANYIFAESVVVAACTCLRHI